MDLTYLGLSNIAVTWRRYAYVTMNTSLYSSVASKRIDLLEENILVSKLMGKLLNWIYNYIKHSQKSRWKASQFKQSHQLFKPRTILSTVEFVENYTFSPHGEIQRRYYHSDQVFYM
jgi:hypothetical protein